MCVCVYIWKSGCVYIIVCVAFDAIINYVVEAWYQCLFICCNVLEKMYTGCLPGTRSKTFKLTHSPSSHTLIVLKQREKAA